MSRLTYHQRLQQVLHGFAKDGQETIVYQELVHKICAQFLAQKTLYGQRYKCRILASVKREVRARRLRLYAYLHSPVVKFTPAGLRFYAAMGTITLYSRDDLRKKYLTIRQLEKHSSLLVSVVDGVQDAFVEFRGAAARIDNMEAVPAAVKDLCDNLERLQVLNSHLELQINYAEGKKMRLLNKLGARVAEGSRE
ncbi:hypothetical protein OH77DRAFT_1429134 [Trametes cingulata]|nr:hypothetical protein OH77DRAFT_1429134 [Trametes cingulata]